MLIAIISNTRCKYVYELQSKKLNAAEKEAMKLAKPMTSKITIAKAESLDSENQVEIASRYQDRTNGNWSCWQA
jgi:hypothetical protein